MKLDNNDNLIARTITNTEWILGRNQLKYETHEPVSFAVAEETENDHQCCRYYYPPDNPDRQWIKVIHPSPGHRCCQWTVPIDRLSLYAHQQNVKYLIIACFRQNVKHFLYLWKLKLRAWIKNSWSTITRILCVCVETRRRHVVNFKLKHKDDVDHW